MQKEEIMPVLTEVITELSPGIIELVRPRFSPRDRMLFDRVWLHCYSNAEALARRYDLLHIPFSVWQGLEILTDICPLAIPGIILHDTGYYTTGRKDWRDPHSRITHMQEGAAFSTGLLAEPELGFTPTEAGIVVGMVVTHDNGYLGIKIVDPDRRVVVDLDRAWVMHPVSFFKDLASQEDLSTEQLFLSRTVSFFGEENPAPEEWGKPVKVTSEDQLQAGNIPSTHGARLLRDRQFDTIWQMIQRDLIGRSGKDEFKKVIMVASSLAPASS